MILFFLKNAFQKNFQFEFPRKGVVLEPDHHPQIHIATGPREFLLFFLMILFPVSLLGKTLSRKDFLFKFRRKGITRARSPPTKSILQLCLVFFSCLYVFVRKKLSRKQFKLKFPRKRMLEPNQWPKRIFHFEFIRKVMLEPKHRRENVL